MAKTKNKVETVAELLYWSYANLAMAHSAVERNHESYGTFHFVIRAKLFKGLKDGTMKMRSIFQDEKIKIQTGQNCNYCGVTGTLALDHLLPKHIGGPEAAENLISACRSCNSSKGKKDLMEWMDSRGSFPPLMVLRRYLKLIYNFCAGQNLLHLKIEEATTLELPFCLAAVPIEYPGPHQLRLHATTLKEPVATPVSPTASRNRIKQTEQQLFDFESDHEVSARSGAQ